MTKQSGLGDNFYLGSYDLSGDVGSLENISINRALLTVTGIDKSAVERLHGIKDGGFDFTSYFNTSGAFPVLKSLPTGDIVCSYFRGTVLGNAAASCIAKQINYDGSRADDGAFTFKSTVMGNYVGVEWGRMLTDGKRTDTVATSPATGLDTTVSRSFGGQAYLHIFAFTGTSVTVKIQDSADNATFADVAGLSFTAATGITAQRIGISNTSTIRRYVRAVTTGTFSNVQFAVNLVKNEEAGVVF